MNKNIKEKFYNDVKLQSLRMTKPRKAMINILEENHLTFKEILAAMQKKGFLNVQTTYNTLYFLLKQNVVSKILIGNDKYYELSLTNQNHDSNFHIHLIDNDNDKPEFTEIYAPEIFSFIKNYDELKKVDIKSIKIIIEIN